MDERDRAYLRQAIEVARRAREHGNMPFGAILVDAEGKVVLEAENTSVTEHDPTGHAETNLMRMAGRRFEPDHLAGCTMYTSCEPCAMCAGAVYWVGVRRIAYALDIPGLDAVVGSDPANPTPHLRADIVLNGGKYPIAIEGPALLEEARAVHDGYWQ
ncbi:MAG: nucleoside deaminase [Actinomycetota bacterium]